ncbi:brix domain-containing protein [Dictyostelium purpureum]|uniref:Brix domain-containing protein n=1 Tax=Dictyostelium purpureum TaxID=5786 RepID=F0ZD55_DICPU|nr:brix domain-containing protein [Dictyostelium purpureum]EGC38118.1 brix domain-containing protein [Dictyostelium purpureum]|eukprot:XP_003285332.1 brix domain-containing protein [Dictyostelium purpureum]
MVKPKKEEDKDDLSPEELKLRRSPTDIKCKAKRVLLVQKLQAAKKTAREKARKQRKKEREMLGDAAPAKQEPRTIESMRRPDDTMVDDVDEETQEDINKDEFESYFDGKPPKVCITTNQRAAKNAVDFAQIFPKLLPNAEFFHRRKYHLKEIIEFCNNRDYTDVIVVNETKGIIDELTITHLPYGPTATFRLTNLVMPEDIPGGGEMTSHKAELIVNGFKTRLGLTVGRIFASIFAQDPNFKGRRVCTLHNQRDFIFFRQHRYIFETKEEANLQELGPRFTLKLKSLQKGTFDTSGGEYIHVHHHNMDVDRKKFVL